jgi:putative ABC transport system permease protein
MLKNYLLVGLRNFLRSSLFSSINLLGMVLGITSSAMILLYAWSELHMDQFHPNGERIYRVTIKHLKDQTIGAVTPGPLAPELKVNFPEVENVARLGKWSGVLKLGNLRFEENNIYFADQSFLEVFDFPLLKGDGKVLDKPTDLLITEAMAEKYFGADWEKRTDVLGSTLSLNNELDLIVAGVMKNPPPESSLHFDFLISFQHLVLNDKWSYQWGSFNFNTFVQLTDPQAAAAFGEKIKDLLKTHQGNEGFELGLQPLREIYLHPHGYDYWTKQGNLTFIKILLVIGCSILFIACFNFINLSTAQSAKRAKEVGVRKTIGATRSQLFLQFLGESFILVAIATLLSRALIDFLLPYFNQLIEREIVMPPMHILFALFLIATLVIGFLSSVYPSLLLSSFQPVNALKGVRSHGGHTFREVLVVMQFCIAFVLMSGTVIVYQQLLYVQDKNLGFDTDQLMYVRLNGPLKENEEVFREELKKLPEVLGASATTSTLADIDNLSNFDWEGKTSENDFSITQVNADPELVPLVGMTIAHGRNISYDIQSDTAAFMINVTAAKQMGYVGEDAIGKAINFWGAKGKVVGVINDFHFRPLTVPIQPLIVRYQPKTYYFYMLVKIDGGQVKQFLAKLPALYKKFDAENPVDFGFVDDELNQSYKNERQAGLILLHFCGLSIFITCLGLLGLAAFSAEKRTKEIGIRKALGARTDQIAQLLSREFLKLMLIGPVVGIPISWWIMNKWLAGFAYHIEISAGALAVTALVCLLIGLLTISSQAIKAAMADPVKSLRSE